MIKKITLSLILMLIAGGNAAAQELQYIGVQGSWWNPNLAGAGFAIEEYGDGFVIAYWYTYNESGEQMWLIGTGDKQGNTVELDMFRTEGGILGDPAGVENVTETAWGTVWLEIEDCGHINMTYDSLDGLSGGYQLLRLRNNPLAAGSCSAIELPDQQGEDPPEPPPGGEPPGDDDPPAAPTVDFSVQKQLADGTWVDVAVPFYGLAVIHKTVSGSLPRMDLFRLKIVAVEGDLVIESFSASEPTGVSYPSIEGLWPGMRIPEGTEATFSLESNTTGGLRVYPYYSVFIEDVGQVVDLTVRLSTQSY